MRRLKSVGSTTVASCFPRSRYRIVAAQSGALEGDRTAFVQLLNKAGSMSAMGQWRTTHPPAQLHLCPLWSNSRQMLARLEGPSGYGYALMTPRLSGDMQGVSSFPPVPEMN